MTGAGTFQGGVTGHLEPAEVRLPAEPQPLPAGFVAAQEGTAAGTPITMIARSETDLAILRDLQRIVRLAGGQVGPDRNVKSAIARAAHQLGLSYRRARSLWYADQHIAVRAAEADRLRQGEARMLVERRRCLLLEAAAIEVQLRQSSLLGGAA
jgi:hypothetical protein